jgi:hypothetical protein
MENLNDINHLDPNDEGLKAVMGNRFHDATAELAKKTAPVTAKAVEEKHTQKKHTVPIATWEPVKHDPTQLERLKACGKSAILFGGLCLLFFYWQQTGLMDPKAAMPCMLTCTLLTGLSIGRHALK